jgi:hypothetical protein
MYAPHVLPAASDYDALYRAFRWHVPAHYNIGVDVCDRWAASEPGRVAIFHVGANGAVQEISYGALRESSNRLANALAAHGIRRGDRVAILLPQAPAVAASHIAIYKLGAIALPLAILFGNEAISYRLQDSGARALITNAQGLEKLAGARAAMPDLELVLSVDGAADGAEDFEAVLARAADEFTPVATKSDDPALMVYTSGTTGPPERRPARPSCVDRSSSRHRVSARIPAAARRPVLDPGGLGLGRRSAQRAAAGPALRRAGGGAEGREVRPRGSVCADGAVGCAQRLHPADGAADAALGGGSEGGPAPALGRLGRRGARRRDLRMGQVGAGCRHQRVLRSDRMQPRAGVVRGARRFARRARSASRCPATRSR